LLVIAGESPIDAAKVPPVKERTESLDRDWAEEPAFAGAPMTVAPAAKTSAD
jgi:nitrate reductase delta subunit